MVLSGWQRACVASLACLIASATAACSQSLFDNHGPGAGGGGGGPDAAIPTSCVAPCVADAAADFDGTRTGVNERWRYLEDHRDRTWVPMQPGPTGMTGADPANHLTTCRANPTAEACTVLPGALLVSSSGATSPADPAIEFTAPATQVIELDLRAYVPRGADQVIRVYRNSREDALFTGTAVAGKTLGQRIVLDALAGDRFLVAVAPMARGAADMGLQLFATATGATFPQTCQLALDFAAASGTAVTDLCRGQSLGYYTEPGTATPPKFAAGPFPELHNAADLAADQFFQAGQKLEQTGELTVQFWLRVRAFVDSFNTAWPFSDLDLDFGGGLGVAITPGVTPRIDLTTCTNTNPVEFVDAITDFAVDGTWRFIRAVYSGGTLALCIDGRRVASVAVPPGRGVQTNYEPYLGKNVVFSPVGSFFDGEIDDVRVFTGALPCP